MPGTHLPASLAEMVSSGFSEQASLGTRQREIKEDTVTLTSGLYLGRNMCVYACAHALTPLPLHIIKKGLSFRVGHTSLSAVGPQQQINRGDMQSHQALVREWEVGNGQWIKRVTVRHGSALWLLAAQIEEG